MKNRLRQGVIGDPLGKGGHDFLRILDVIMGGEFLEE
jgi:hypothetical protein